MKYENKKRGIVFYTDENGIITSKVCSKCNVEIPLEEYRRKNDGLGGKHSVCKTCESVGQRRYRLENSEKVRGIHQRYYQENRDLIREKQRKYHKDNPEVSYNRNVRWRKNFPEKSRETAKKWRARNPEKTLATMHRRLARKRNLPDTLTSKESEKIINHFGGCALTGSGDYQMDHAIPLNVGHGGTTYGNMIPLRSDLNTSKNDRNIFEWFEVVRQRFELSQESFDSLIEWLASANAVSVEDYRDYVYWCHENPHSLEDLLEEGEAI